MLIKKRFVMFFLLVTALLMTGCRVGGDNTDVYYVGGNVTGLIGTGLILENHAGAELFITTNGTYRFPTALTNGSNYAVTIKAMPGNPSQQCSISNGSGVIAGKNVGNVDITCTADYYTVGGSVTGLNSNGLVLQNNGGDDLSILFNGGFSFSTPLVDTNTYNVTILIQPNDPIQQTCTVSNGSGVLAGSDFSDISVDCVTNTYTIGGTVTGLAGSGLVMQYNGGDYLPRSTNGAFTFPTPLDDGEPYTVTVKTQPSSPNQLCTVTNGTGLLAGSNVTNVTVTCENAYAVGGTISGLTGTGLVLQNNGGDDLAINNDGSFTFPQLVADNNTYEIKVSSHPDTPVQLCTIANGAGTISGSNVGNVTVSCVNADSIGGTVTGLAGTGLILQNNGSDDLPIDANGNFRFNTPLAGGSYDVTVLTQPTGPDQNCSVVNGSGAVSGSDITDIVVDCVYINAWIWQDGSDAVNPPGDYGTLGTPDPNNAPPGRKDAINWTDTGGVQWLFGGLRFDPNANPPDVPADPDYLNDLWQFDGSNWTWVGGSNLANQPGSYGTQGTADPANNPGARYQAVSWTDNTGNQWVFGGFGFDTNGDAGYLNDLWKFDGSNWTWMGGSDVVNQPGSYGIQGIADPANIPSGRSGSVTWKDTAGNLWLFGGLQFDPNFDPNLDPLPPYEGYMNDLWKFDGSNWTWIGGSDLPNQAGTYGSQGTPSASNIPGGREGAGVWLDNNGSLWLLGGWGLDSTGNTGYMNDLWSYAGGLWIWVGGSNLVNQPGSYGTQGAAEPDNTPGARQGGITWTDASGKLWLLGGAGFDASGNQHYLNDLWKFDGTNWIWIGGSNGVDQPGIYGTQGTADPANIPGGREGAITWKNLAGEQRIFGGWGLDALGNEGDLNDLWQYLP